MVTADGAVHQLDVIVYCTGFQAWRFLEGIDVTGSGGADLHQHWGQDPAAIDEANALMAWGAEGTDNWYKSPTGRVSQNWPLTTIEYWDLTRAPDPGHYRFSGQAVTSKAGKSAGQG